MDQNSNLPIQLPTGAGGLAGLREMVANLPRNDELDSSKDITVRPATIKVFPQNGIFQIRIGDTVKSVTELLVSIVWMKDKLKRNYLRIFDENNPSPPDCSSDDSISGTRRSTTYGALVEEMGLHKIAQVMGHRVFGDCDGCFFNGFNTSQNHTNNFTRKGKQCGDYAIASVLLGENPLEDNRGILQIPPSGAQMPGTIVDIAKKQGGVPEHFLWRLHPTGGGKNKKSMLAVPVGVQTPETVQFIFDLHKAQMGMKAEIVRAFTQGVAVEKAGSDDGDEPNYGGAN